MFRAIVDDDGRVMKMSAQDTDCTVPIPDSMLGTNFDGWRFRDGSWVEVPLPPISNFSLDDLLSPYEGSDNSVIHAMLSLARLEPGENIIDLGSGDGRVLVAAVNDFNAGTPARPCIGWELQNQIYQLAETTLNEKLTGDVKNRVRIVCGNALDAIDDVKNADVVTLFLMPYGIDKLVPMLNSAMPVHDNKRRLVSYMYPVFAWEPAEETMTLENGTRLFMYRR